LTSSSAQQTYKYEVPLDGEQGGRVLVAGREEIMLASNNYLGLANHPAVKEAARRALDEWGFGMSSVRFICGTQPLHLELERRIAAFVGCEAAILHGSCFAANEAFFTGLLANDFGQPAGFEDVDLQRPVQSRQHHRWRAALSRDREAGGFAGLSQS
jgi:glycine C-acetyltransferase